jgi:hypothetical protein
VFCEFISSARKYHATSSQGTIADAYIPDKRQQKWKEIDLGQVVFSWQGDGDYW